MVATLRNTGSVRWLYGTGGVGLGILETGVYNFVLIYYSQVLGLSASLAGLAVSLILVSLLYQRFVMRRSRGRVR